MNGKIISPSLKLKSIKFYYIRIWAKELSLVQRDFKASKLILEPKMCKG